MFAIARKQGKQLASQLTDDEQPLREWFDTVVEGVEAKLDELLEDTRDIKQTVHRIEDKIDELQPSPSGDAHSPVPREVSPAKKSFTGRTELLEELVGLLTGGSVAICSTHGTGGVGKTELGRRLCERVAGHFPGGQVFIGLRGNQGGVKPLSARELLQAILRRFVDSTAQLPDDVERLLGMYHSLLGGRRVLLFLDDARDAEQVQPLLPPPPTCVALVTTREQFVLPGCEARNLAQLTRTESCDLLRKLSPRLRDAGDESLINTLAEQCGDLPLALEIVGCLLEETPTLTIAKFTIELRQLREQIRQGAKNDQERFYAAIKAALSTSLKRLSNKLRQRWRELSVFAGDFDLQAAQAVCDSGDKHPVRKDLDRLIKLSLLEYSPDDNRYRLHDLTRDFAAGELETKSLTHPTRLRHARQYHKVLRTAQVTYRQGHDQTFAGLWLYDQERANIDAAFDWLREQPTSERECLGLVMLFPNAGVYVLRLRQSQEEYTDWLTTQLAAAERLSNRGHQAKASGNLGLIYRMRGDLDRAEDMHRQSLAIEEELGDKEGMANQYGNLGSVYMERRDLDRAGKMHLQSLAIEKKLGRKEGMATQYANLGQVAKQRGYVDEARRLCELARGLYAEIGMPHRVEHVRSWLDGL